MNPSASSPDPVAALPAYMIETWPVARLKKYERNARLHSPKQVQQLRDSFRKFGQVWPILVREDATIIAGHGRLEAAKAEGYTEVRVIVAAGWSEEQCRAFGVLDNKVALNSEWDEKLLGAELAELSGFGVDLGMLGFDPQELTALSGAGEHTGHTDPDEVPEPPANPIAIVGDLWGLGRHRLLCGDALDPVQVRRLTGGAVPDLANCDPPYGISIVKGASVGGAKPFGKRGTIGGWQHRPGKELGGGRMHGEGPAGPALGRKKIIRPNSYAPVIGDDSIQTAVSAYDVLIEIGVPAIVLWGGNYFASEIPPSRCWLVWDKENSGSFADAELAWTNQDKVVQLLRHKWNGLIKASERGESRVHPTQKPVALAEWVIETIAPEAKNVVDLFLGSGSTLIACERKSVTCFGAELAPAYIDVCIKRWQDFTGQQATLEGDGRTFAEIKAERERAAA